MPSIVKIDPIYCQNGQWNIHEALKTVAHAHYSMYDSDPSCDLMIAETNNGKFFIGESFDGEGRGHPDVFCESGKNDEVKLYDTFEEAQEVILFILAELTGQQVQHLRRSAF